MSHPDKLTVVTPGGADSAPVQEYLTFELGDAYYSLPLRSVHEILRTLPITVVPRAPDFVVGVITVRGKIITVMDPAKRLNVDSPSVPGRVLLVHNGEEIVGVAVQRVVQVHRLLSEDIEYTSDIGGDLSEFIVGVARPVGVEESEGEEDVLILLDPLPLLRVQ